MRKHGSFENELFRSRGMLDIGGEFLTRSVTCVPGAVRLDMVAESGAYKRQMIGCSFVAFQANMAFGAVDCLNPSSNAELDAFGTHAIAVTIPTNPLAGMGVFLGELRDLPKLPFMESVKNVRKNLRHFKKATRGMSQEAAGEYLNGVFGWAPFISDLQKFCKVVKHHESYIEQFRKGSGQLIRRRYSGEEESTTDVQDNMLGGGYASPALDTYGYYQRGTLSLTTQTSTKRWFSGAYTYYLPNVDSFVGRAKEAEALANHLYGLRVTPDLLYKLAPWSWALDWVTNTGDIIHNWSAFQNDGLVMQYGYVMETKSQTLSYCCSNVGFVGNPLKTLTQVIRKETKCRRRATPYGFGLNSSGFSLKQWSIIAALGISRTPRSLSF
jgi:hypothetical protein